MPPSVIKDVYGVDVGPGFQVVGEAGSGEETIRVVRSAQPDLLLLDLSMPRMTGLEALREIAPVRESLRTIMLAGRFERDDLLTAVQLGVRGLLLKTHDHGGAVRGHDVRAGGRVLDRSDAGDRSAGDDASADPVLQRGPVGRRRGS